jgi:hypothetical protein
MVPLHCQGTFRKPGFELSDACHAGEVESTEDQWQRIAEGIDHTVVVLECAIAQLQGHYCLHCLLSSMLACHEGRGVSPHHEQNASHLHILVRLSPKATCNTDVPWRWGHASYLKNLR